MPHAYSGLAGVPREHPQRAPCNAGLQTRRISTSHRSDSRGATWWLTTKTPSFELTPTHAANRDDARQNGEEFRAHAQRGVGNRWIARRRIEEWCADRSGTDNAGANMMSRQARPVKAARLHSAHYFLKWSSPTACH